MDEKTFHKKQLRMSLWTIFLTPIFSGLVVFYQLSYSQSQWHEQRMIISEQKLFEQRVKRLEKVSELLNLLKQNSNWTYITQVNLKVAAAISLVTDEKIDIKDGVDKQLQTILIQKKYISELLSLMQSNEFVFYNSKISKSSIALYGELKNFSGSDTPSLDIIKTEVAELSSNGFDNEYILNSVTNKYFEEYDDSDFEEKSNALIFDMMKIIYGSVNKENNDIKEGQ